MSDKLGFTFYPKDWWTSESYFELTPIQRYYYLECLFIMYSNDGVMKTQKNQFENRTRTMVLQNDWEIVISKFELINDNYTHVSVNKRLRKAVANRENGKLGGRPKKEVEKPKKPSLETQKNPPLERERESEKETKENIINNSVFFDECKTSSQWLEVTAMQNKVKTDVIILFLVNFENHLVVMEEQKKSLKEVKEHFTHWLNKQDLSNFREKIFGKTNQI
jgi:hypothetical protein